jgi:hypothetical protein
VAHVVVKRNAYRVFMGRFKGRRTFGRWENNIKMDLQDGRAWTGLIGLRTGTGGGLF